MVWDGLRKHIFNDEPGTEQAAPVAKPTAPTSTLMGGAAPQSFSMQPQVSPEFVAAIKKTVLGRNTALTQLLTAADKLEGIIPDASTRIKAAFKMAGDGRTPTHIAEAVDIHLADVDGEEMRFKAVIDQKAAQEVGGLESRAAMAAAAIQNSQLSIEQAQARIAELMKVIAEKQTEQAQAMAEAQAKRHEIEQASVGFKAAANAVRAELQGHKVAIMSALS